MQHELCFKLVHRALRDIRDCPDKLFGGALMVLGGDFAQIPPVVKKGSRSQTVDASILLIYMVKVPCTEAYRKHENPKPA